MSVKEKLQADLPVLMKAGKSFEVGVVRMVLGEITKAEKSGKVAKELNEGEAQKVLSGWADKRESSAALYREAGAEDRALNELAEAEFIRTYLPAPLTEDELNAIVGEAISVSGATSMKEMGKVIKVVMAKDGMATYGKKISELVRNRLG